MAKILLIDDDMDFTMVTSAVLKSKGHLVTSAASGEDGFRKARDDKPDLLLMDVMMRTDGEGFEYARKFKEDPATSGIPVILVTGIRKARGLPFSYEPDKDWLPVSAVLDKPVKPETLFKAIDAAL